MGFIAQTEPVIGANAPTVEGAPAASRENGTAVPIANAEILNPAGNPTGNS